MGDTYTRQSTYADGDVVTAAHSNDEFNQLLAAFAASSGHTHDGTAGEGGPIAGLLANAITLGAGQDVDIALAFNANTNDGLLTWKEDEDYFEFNDDILIATTEKLQFRDTAIYIHSSADGQLDLVADTEIQLAATTIDINGNVDISGTANLDVVDIDGAVNIAATTTIATNNKIIFRDAAIFLNSSADGQLDIVADTEIQIAATTIDINGAVDVSGNLSVGGDLDVTGSFDMSDANITNIGSIALDTITNDGTDITLDSSGDIILDAGGNNVIVKSGGTSILDIANNSTDVELTVSTADKNFVIKGTDGSSAITALDIDMALAGKATFSGDVVVTGDLTITGDDLVMATNTAGALLIADGTNFNPTVITDLSEIGTAASGDILLAIDASGGGLKKITRSTLTAGLASDSAISNVVEDTSPQLGGNLDTNSQNILIDDAHFIGDESGNEQIIFQTTGSAVNQFDITNSASSTAFLQGPILQVTGGDSNIDLNLIAKGTGVIAVRGNSASGAIQFNCESNSHGQIVQGQPHSAGVTNTMLLPAGANSTLVSLVSADTLTNKTLTAPTLTGTATVASLDISGDIDVDGTTNLDVVDIDGAVNIAAATTIATNNKIIFRDAAIHISSTADGDLSIAADDEIDLTSTLIDINGNVEISGTVAAADAITMATNKKVVFRDAALFINSSADGQLDLAADTEIELTATTVDVVGNFTNSGTIVSTGKITSDAGIDIDNFNIDGTTIALSSGDMTVDVAGDLILDAGGGDFKFGVGDTEILRITNSSSDVIIKPIVDAKDIIFQQRDGTAVMTVEDDISLTVNNDVFVTGRATGTQTADNDGNFDLRVSNFWTFTPDGDDTITLSNPAVGQSGIIYLDNSGGHDLSAHASIAINADVLSALDTAGKYMLSYYCTATSGNDTILMSATGALA